MKEKWHTVGGFVTLLLLLSSLIPHCFLCAVGEDDATFAPAGLVDAAAAAAPCWFLCDFPALLLSDFGPGCRTFTPRIICEVLFN
jgi:hypothetical protein